MQLVDKTKKA